MSPQVQKFAQKIRAILSNFDSPEAAAEAYREDIESYGMIFDDAMLRDLAEAAKAVRASIEDVVILHKSSLIASTPDWYDGPQQGDIHWPALRGYLENTKKWNPDTIDSIDDSSNEVVSLLGDPSKEQLLVRGLVVGYVQSGKTANMTAVISKAVDAGYNLIVVLGGVTNKLRAQTQGRFESDIVNRNRHLWHLYTTTEDDGDFSYPANGSFTMPREGFAQLIVMKKEGSRLRAFNRTIKKTPASILKKLKVLLIDDECDQASVNSARGDYDMTRINEQIRLMIKSLPAVSYVGYTATPFANVFIDPFPHNKEELDDLYPQNFITALERPIGYFGALEVFGGTDASEDDDDRDMVRILPENELPLLRPSSMKEKSTFIPQMTDSLRDAVLWFLASCAIRRLRGQQDKHSTMLVHSSQYVDQHEHMSQMIRNWIAQHESDLLADRGPVSKRFDQLVEDERTRTSPAGEQCIPESLVAIRSTLSEVFQALEYAVENGPSDIRLDYETGPKTYIVVGGTVLARGLTLEGLIVSFFLRTTKQYDTLLQMGRWFGFRIGYDDLPRLWTTADLISKFRSLATIEEEIREDIAAYREHRLTPMDFAVKVRAIPGMAITSASKMKHAIRSSMSFDGRHVQTIRFDHRDVDIVRGNWSAAAALVDEVCTTGKRDSSERRPLFRHVPVACIRKFLLNTRICDGHMDLKQEHLLAYLDRMGTSLDRWNVGVIVPNAPASSERELGSLGKVALVNRSKLKASPAEYADIKALMSKQDILIDAESPKVEKGEGWKDLKARRPDLPLLLLYPVDGRSRSKTASKSRTDLDAVGDLIGFGMVFPGAQDQAGEYFQVELDAPTPEQLDEDELAEVEGGTNG